VADIDAIQLDDGRLRLAAGEEAHIDIDPEDSVDLGAWQ
jgi:hypothetical protein